MKILTLYILFTSNIISGLCVSFLIFGFSYFANVQYTNAIVLGSQLSFFIVLFAGTWFLNRKLILAPKTKEDNESKNRKSLFQKFKDSLSFNDSKN